MVHLFVFTMKRPIKYDLETWNALNPVGSPCVLILDDGTEMPTRTRSIAWELGHGQAVVKVEGKSGGWELERVRMLEALSVNAAGEPRPPANP